MAVKRAPVVIDVKPSSKELVQARVEGSKLLTPIRTDVEKLEITDEEGYLQADFLLARITSARNTWRTKIDPILRPLKEAVAKAKEALDHTKILDKEVDGPLEALEGTVKGAMRDYKLAEARQLQAAREEEERKAQALRDEAMKKAAAAISARTPQMRAKLEQARADLEQQATATEMQAEAFIPVRGAASTTRTVQKIRIADPVAFVSALRDYAPRAGIYQIGHPPLTILTHKIHKTKVGGNAELVESGSAVECMVSEVGKIFAMQPGVVQSWPGVEVYDDIIIAKK